MLSQQTGDILMSADWQISERPIPELVTAIRELDAEITLLENQPLTEAILRERCGGFIPMGKGCELAVGGTTEERDQLRADKEHLAREFVTARADYAKLHAENERLRAALEPLLPMAAGYLEVIESQGDPPDPSERKALATARAVIASSAPSDSDPDVDAATGCADDQSGLGAVLLSVGPTRVKEIVDGFFPRKSASAPGTDWRKLCFDLVDATDVCNQADTPSDAAGAIQAEHLARLLTDAEVCIYDAVRREREREKGPDYDAS